MKKGAFLLLLVFLIVLPIVYAQEEAAVESETIQPPSNILKTKIIGVSWYWWALLFLGLGSFAFYLQSSAVSAREEATKHVELKEIRGVVLQQLGLKKSLPEIRSFLSMSGYDEALIRRAIAKIEIYKYIVDHLKKRHSEEDIKDHLISYGWSRADIDPLIKRAKNNIVLTPERGPAPIERFKSKGVGIYVE